MKFLDPTTDLIIKSLQQEHISSIVKAFEKLNWDKPEKVYLEYLKEQEEGERCVWIAFLDDIFVGYVTLKWHSDYPYFNEHGIPEIKDLNVLPPYRNQGLGSTLLTIAQDEAAKRSKYVGLGFGLYADYGPAQRLYIKRGYIPDGNGITYKYQPVKYGDMVPVDDLVLWLTKKLI